MSFIDFQVKGFHSRLSAIYIFCRGQNSKIYVYKKSTFPFWFCRFVSIALSLWHIAHVFRGYFLFFLFAFYLLHLDLLHWSLTSSFFSNVSFSSWSCSLSSLALIPNVSTLVKLLYARLDVCTIVVVHIIWPPTSVVVLVGFLCFQNRQNRR